MEALIAQTLPEYAGQVVGKVALTHVEEPQKKKSKLVTIPKKKSAMAVSKEVVSQRATLLRTSFRKSKT